MSPFLAWGDFHARSRFARSTIPEEKWGTTRSLTTRHKQSRSLCYEIRIDPRLRRKKYKNILSNLKIKYSITCCFGIMIRFWETVHLPLPKANILPSVGVITFRYPSRVSKALEQLAFAAGTWK